MGSLLDPGWQPAAKPSGLRLVAPVAIRCALRAAGWWRCPAFLALLLILPARAADRPPVSAAASAPAHALIQLAGQPLSGGRSRGTVSLPLERAEGGHTPVLDFQVLGVGAASGSSADAASPGPAPFHRRQGARIRLLLDTGATSTMVTPELAERLALVRRPLPAGTFGLAGGGHGCADLNPQRTRLPDLLLRDPAAPPGTPGLSLEGVEALVLPVAALPAGVDGVLGAPSLRLLPIRIDPSLGRIALGAAALDQLPFPLSLSSSATPPARSSAPRDLQPTAAATPRSRPQRVPLRWHRGVPLLQLSTSVGPVQALADTGAEGLFLQPALAARLLPLGPAQPLRLVGFCGEQRVERRLYAGLGLGPGEPVSTPGSPSPGDGHAGVEGIVTDNPIFEQLGVEAILGQELLHRHRQLWRLDKARPELLLW
ncbi:aspartyl protease family protein [Vulcanococcus limneticus]|uniref:aspartyl protease family protein n=1 Tax=Vulcanococcus limneticus TaxID=2170428 RepID=UPI00398BD0A1